MPERYLRHTDMSRAGYGPINGVMMHDPQAYACYIHAFLNLGHIAQAVQAADWLIAHAQEGKGWGDNFEEGHTGGLTRYGVTIGFVADALHEVSVVTGDRTYRDTARSAILDYAQYMDARGLHWYSNGLDGDGNPDHRVIPNVTAVLIGATQRIAEASADDTLAQLARRNYEALMSIAQDSGDCITWRYFEERPKENDFNHAGMTAYGLLRYGAAPEVIAKAMRALWICVRDGVIYRYEDPLADVRARAHGLGISLVCARLTGDEALAQLILDNLPEYQIDDIYAQWALKPEPYYPRIQARVAWGLSQPIG